MLQVEPCFVNAAGPLGWKQVGGPLPLENACCLHGVPLTYLQIKKLIKAFGGSIKGTPPKRTLQLQLIDMILPPEQHEEAKALIENEKGTKDDGFDSDFSELISELGQDEGNTQDLKEYKDKKKVRKLKRKMAAAGAEEVPKPKKKPKSKAKAKAKGKGKGKAGGKGGKGKKAKKGLWASLLKKAQAMRQEEIEKEAGGEDAGMREEEVEKKADMGMGEATETGGGAQVEAEGATSSGSKEEKAAADEDSKDASMQEVEAQGAPSSGSKEEKAAADAGSKDASMQEVEGEKGPGKKRLHGDDDAAEPRRTKKYKSPQEILDMLQPPGCKLTLGFIDHRFSSKFEADDPRLSGKLKQKTFSKSFAERRGWQEALKEVHAHNWEKWDKIKDKFPLPAGVEPQVPGDISEEVLDLLKPVIADMPSLAKPK